MRIMLETLKLIYLWSPTRSRVSKGNLYTFVGEIVGDQKSVTTLFFTEILQVVFKLTVELVLNFSK